MNGAVMRVYGQTVDEATRCVHYHSESDVVAIKFACCGRYYPCFECHAGDVSHATAVWPQPQWDEKAILCGVCRTELTIAAYKEVSACPHCHAAFNDGCRLHAHLYFEVPATPVR